MTTAQVFELLKSPALLGIYLSGLEERLSRLEHVAKPPYSGVSVERLVSRRACANGVQAETEDNAPISREAPQARAANT